jgi:nucleotide-binding universal stress UspA family protein
MFRKILCATDLTEGSTPALRLALELGREHDAEVHVLHVAEQPYAPRGYFHMITQGEIEFMTGMVERHESAARKLIEESVRSLAPVGGGGEGVRAQVHVRRGVAADVIVGCARELATDLLVTGTHARKGLGHLVMGSVAERLVRTAPCPVLVARAREAT